MRYKVRINSPTGDYRLMQIYEIDANALLAMSGATIQIAPTTAQGFKIHKWSVSNNNIYTGIAADVPRKPEQDGNIFATRHAYNYNLGGYKYLEDWFDTERWEAVTSSAAPSDWGTTTQYYRVWGGSDPTGFKIVWPYLYGASAGDYDKRNTYRDKKNMTSVIFYTDTGTKFSVSKTSCYAAAATINPQCWRIGYAPTNSNNDNYRFCTAGGTALHNSLNLTYDADRSSTTITTNSINIIQCGIHYTYNGQEYYGFAQIRFDSFADSAIPVQIDVIGLSPDFFGTSIIPGGGGGGSWGSDTVIGGGDGVWTYGSDSRGDGTGAIGTAIATEARTATDAFFTGANGFKLHQLLAADIPDIYGALYSTSFIERYQNTMYSPLSAVLSVHMIPQKLLDLDHATTSSDLTLSGYNISTNVTNKQYPQIPTVHSYHLSKITLDATDTYLDYAPYTNAYLHLPYIGVLTLDINAIAAGEIAIDYITDAITGNCSALVWCKDRDGHAQPKYVAQGNCAYTLPMFSYNQDGSALGRIASSALGLSMAVATGNIAGAAAGAGSLASGMFDAATAKQNTQITGAFGGNAGMISDTMVWLEIVRPKWCNPEHYQLINGLPSQLSGTIQSFNEYGDGYTGYLRITDIDTDGIQATDAEIRQIEQQLKAGIFVDTT